MPLETILARHDNEIQSLVSVFDEELTKMLMKAQASTIARVTSKLKFIGGKLTPTPANRAQVRQLSNIFMDEMSKLGLQDLVDAFVGKFDGQIKFFKQVLQDTLGDVDASALSAITLGPVENKLLSMNQEDAATWLEDVVGAAAIRLKDKALLSVGGLNQRKLADVIATELAKTPGEAKTVASTTISSFYRTVADISFKKVEEDRNFQITYKYVGPPSGDPVIRPFCERLMEETEDGETWTRAEIDVMKNGQLPDVMVTGGGYNCRHQWIVAEVKKMNISRGASA